MEIEKIEKATGCLKALSHPIRLWSICALRDGELPVQSLESSLKTSPSNMSQHLATMRDREILKTRREGNQTFYSVRDERMFQLLDLLQSIYCKPEE